MKLKRLEGAADSALKLAKQATARLTRAEEGYKAAVARVSAAESSLRRARRQLKQARKSAKTAQKAARKTSKRLSKARKKAKRKAQKPPRARVGSRTATRKASSAGRAPEIAAAPATFAYDREKAPLSRTEPAAQKDADSAR
jgi:chromosome segregation ATPase